MTHKDYRFLAEEIKNMKLTNLNRIFLAEHLADAYKKRDKVFKREPFLEWCGVL